MEAGTEAGLLARTRGKRQEASMEAGTEAGLLAKTRGKKQAWRQARRQDFLLEQGARGKHGSRHGGSAAC